MANVDQGLHTISPTNQPTNPLSIWVNCTAGEQERIGSWRSNVLRIHPLAATLDLYLFSQQAHHSIMWIIWSLLPFHWMLLVSFNWLNTTTCLTSLKGQFSQSSSLIFLFGKKNHCRLTFIKKKQHLFVFHQKTIFFQLNF